MPRETSLEESNRLVLACRAKLRALKECRGLTEAEMAKQLGCQEATLHELLYSDRHVPGPELSRRIVLWAWKNADFTRAPRLRAQWGADERMTWPTFKVRLPPKLEERLNAACAKWGYGKHTFIQVAIERLIDDEPTLTTLEDAIRRLETTRTARLLTENTSLREILEGNVELAAEVGKRPKEYQTTPDPGPHAVQGILGMEVQDGPAQRIADPDEVWLEEA